MSLQFTSRVIFKGVWRDLKSYFRYRAFFIGTILEMVSLTLGFAIIGGAYYFSPKVLTLIGLEDSDLFLFMLSGAILQMFASVATWAPLNRVEEDIHFGTIEAIFVSPSTRMGYMVSTTISRAIINTIFFIPLYILTLWLAGALTNFIIIGYTLIIALLTIVTNISVGIYFGMFGLITRQARIFVSMTHQLIQFLFGAFLPVQGFMAINEGFGTVMKYITLAFPFTYNFDLMRHFMFGDKYITLLPIRLEFILLACCFVFYIVLARILLVYVEKKAKNKGLAIL